MPFWKRRNTPDDDREVTFGQAPVEENRQAGRELDEHVPVAQIKRLPPVRPPTPSQILLKP